MAMDMQDSLEEFTDAQLQKELEDRGFAVYAEDESCIQDAEDAADMLLKRYIPQASLGDRLHLTTKIKAALVELGVSEGDI